MAEGSRCVDGSVEVETTEVEMLDGSAHPDLADPRVVEGGADDAERAAESALRPRRLDEFVGQRVVREQLSLVLEAARRYCAASHAGRASKCSSRT